LNFISDHRHKLSATKDSFFSKEDYKEIYQSFSIQPKPTDDDKIKEITYPPIEQRPESPAAIARKKAKDKEDILQTYNELRELLLAQESQKKG